MLTLGELASHLGCELRGDPDVVVRRVAPLQVAAGDELAFIANRAYRRHLPGTRAGAVVLRAEDAGDCPVACLIHPNPYACYARAAARLHPRPAHPAGVDPSAVIAAGARVHASASVGPLAFVGDGAVVGPHARIGPGCVIGAGCRVGEATELVSRVTLEREVVVGDRCLIHAGAVLGADGFGFAPDAGGWVKVPQLGRVIVGNDVEIGANTTIDRGTIGDTVIEDDVKLDNQIQIGHNVVVGAHTAVAAMAGVAGSTRIGSGCLIGGQAGIGGHLTIADGVEIAGQAMVTRSIRRAGRYGSGVPAEEASRWHRNVARFRQLHRLEERVRALEERAGRAVDPESEKESE